MRKTFNSALAGERAGLGTGLLLHRAHRRRRPMGHSKARVGAAGSAVRSGEAVQAVAELSSPDRLGPPEYYPAMIGGVSSEAKGPKEKRDAANEIQGLSGSRSVKLPVAGKPR